MTGASRSFRTRILGTGSYLPEKLLTNADLEKMVDTNDAWIVERTGIKVRHIAAPHEVTSDLCYVAATRALEAAGLTAQDLDLIIVASVSPDQIMPSTACVLQNKLGARNVMAFDLSAACSGFLYNLTIAEQFIKNGTYKNILIVGAEILTRFIDYTERETCILFGDGAGAMIVGRAEEDQDCGIMSLNMHADGSLAELLILHSGGSKMPFTEEVLKQKHQYVRMKGKEIFKNAVRAMVNASKTALEDAKFDKENVDWLVPHQANVRIIEAVADYFGFDHKKCIINVDHMGNTSAATIPVAFDEAVRDGRIKRGQNILLTAFGAGLTSGSILLRY